MKKILIIGGGFLQSFVIKKAKDLGYYTIVIDRDPDAIGFQFADEYGIIDIADQKACLNFALNKQIDGVMTAATDFGVLSSSLIAEKLNLPGLNYQVAELIKNKYKVRKKLFEANVDDISQFFSITNIQEVKNLKDKIKYPIMVKPADGSGSKGIKKVDNHEDLLSACDFALNSSLSKTVLIEDFINGREYGAESVVYDGKVHVLGVMKKDMSEPPVYAELGHSLPNDLEDDSKIRLIVERAITELGINFGAVNMDLLVTEDNKVYIIDVGARMGGNLIGSHIIPIGTGINYLENLIKIVMGEQGSFEVINQKMCISTRLLALNPGVVKELPNFQEFEKSNNVKIFHYLKQDSVINKYRNNLDSWGYVVSIGENPTEVYRKAEQVRKIIDEKIIRY